MTGIWQATVGFDAEEGVMSQETQVLLKAGTGSPGTVSKEMGPESPQP